MMLIAWRIYRPAVFSWMVRGDLLPDADTVAGWKAKFLERWDRYAPSQLKGTSAELRRWGRFHARVLDRLAALSRRQQEQMQKTYQAYLNEILANQEREQAEGAS
jgi:hypothetical protein